MKELWAPAGPLLGPGTAPAKVASVYSPRAQLRRASLFEGGGVMKSKNRKWWLAGVALLCLASTGCPVEDTQKSTSHDKRPVKHATVPEGGSSLVYVLGAGVTCLGAMLVRSRAAKPKES